MLNSFIKQMFVRPWVILIGIGLVISLSFAINHQEPSDQEVGPATISIETATVTTHKIPHTVFAVGSSEALNSAVIRSEVDGRIVKIFFKDGDFVSQGMPLIQLDDSQASADVAKAQADLNLSKTTYARYLAAQKEGAFSQQDIDKQRADVESKQADLKSALATLAEKKLLAPFSGYLGAFVRSQGDFIKSGDALVDLVNRDEIRVIYTVSEQFLSELQLGQTAMITADGLPGKSFSGKVTFIAPKVDDVTRSIAIQARVQNHDGELAPGMLVHIKQVLSENPNATVVPEQAVGANLSGNFVFVLDDKQVKRVAVKIGARYEGYAEILDGLNVGDIVATTGLNRLQNGSLVHVVSAPPDETPTPASDEHGDQNKEQHQDQDKTPANPSNGDANAQTATQTAATQKLQNATP